MCWTHENQSLNFATNKRPYEIDYRTHLNEFSVSKSFYWKQCKWDQQKFTLIFLSKNMFTFLLHLLIENFKQQSYGFERNNKIWCLNGYDFELYQTTFHKKNYHDKLFNSIGPRQALSYWGSNIFQKRAPLKGVWSNFI